LSKIKILIAGGHKILRQGIHSLLAFHPDFEVIAETGNGIETVKKTLKLKPDVVLMDAMMPNLNGFEATRQIKNTLPECNVLILSKYQDDSHALRAFQTGASGYISKELGVEELLTAIQAVSNNQCYLCPSVSRIMIETYLGKKNINRSSTSKSRLRR